MKHMLVYLLLINAVAFILMRTDKKLAKKKLWRISESALLSLAIIGGSLGSLLGMYIFHHKTKRAKFTVTIPLLVILHAVFLLICYQYM